ncbi:MAG: sulfite exporter TauE/SafE family protein [Pseudomonadota bacterium]
MDQFFLIPAALLTGAVAGLLGGLLGIGGGVIIVPALILALDLDPRFAPEHTTIVAVATSLSCVLGVSLSAARAQLRAGNVSWSIVGRWGPFLVLGALLAAPVAEQLPLPVFRTAIGAFLAFAALVMLTRWQPDPGRTDPPLGLVAPIATAGGLVSGLAGIGGGNVIVPTLVYFNVPMHRATANSSTLGVPIASAGALAYLVAGLSNPDLALPPGTWGYVYWPASLAVIGTAMAAAPLGVRIAQRIDPVPLRRLFGLLLLFVAGRMLYSALGFVS